MQRLRALLGRHRIDSGAQVGAGPPGLGLAHHVATLGRAGFEDHCRANRSYEYLVQSRGLCRVLGQPLMFVDTADMTFTPHMITNGFWESWITVFVASVTKPGMVALDIGANHGYYTLLLADAVGATGHVVAVEPLPDLARLIGFSLDLNGYTAWTRVVEAAAGDHDGEVTLAVQAGRPMNSEVLEAQDRKERSDDWISHRLRVPCRTVDDIAGETRVDVVKIDVEGAEAAVWRGMAGVLERNRDIQIIMEFNPARYDDAGAFLADVAAAGFPLRFVDDDARAKPASPGQLVDHRGDWMLYLRRSAR